MAVLVFGILEAPARGWTQPVVLGSIGRRVCCLTVAFGFVEVRRGIRCSTFACSRCPAFATGAATITVFFLSMFGYMFLLMQYMQLILGYSPIKTAFGADAADPGPDAGAVGVLVLVPAPARVCARLCSADCCSSRSGSCACSASKSDSPYWRARLAHVGAEHRHRTVHRPDDFGDHDHRSRRQAGGGVGGQRRHSRDRSRARHRVGRLHVGRQYPKTLAPSLIGFPSR